MRSLALIAFIACATAAEPVVTVTSDAAGNRTTTSTLTDEHGTHTTTLVHDSTGKLLTVTKPNGETDKYIYDSAEQLLRIDLVLSHHSGIVTTVYDDHGTLIRVVMPDEQVPVVDYSGKPVP